ncbi:MAG TPA: helix-turn-helix domain-containing protein [Frankiaceae bacterium]|jgi:AcrR family transcriptional regulator|nr:helix-turn-helix domain-containing protein [Frankiaceae bacterium]
MRQDAVRNRRHLVAAARRVFGRDGLDSGVEAVAKQAGVGTGTLYRHFPSKDDLIAALLEDLSDEVLASAQSALDHRDGSGIWEFMQATGAIQADSQGLLGLLWREGRRPERVAAIREIIAELVKDAHRHHTLAAGVSQQDIILILHGLRGVIESAHDGTDEDAWKRYLELATGSLRPRKK